MCHLRWPFRRHPSRQHPVGRVGYDLGDLEACWQCGSVFVRSKMKAVTTIYIGGAILEQHYCHQCAPEWDRVERASFGETRYYKCIPGRYERCYPPTKEEEVCAT